MFSLILFKEKKFRFLGKKKKKKRNKFVSGRWPKNLIAKCVLVIGVEVAKVTFK